MLLTHLCHDLRAIVAFSLLVSFGMLFTSFEILYMLLDFLLLTEDILQINFGWIIVLFNQSCFYSFF